jgi:hypothetical protein
MIFYVAHPSWYNCFMSTLIPKELEVPLTEFRNSLNDSDLLVLDDPLLKAQELHPAIRHSGHDLPYQVALLALLIEEHKEVGQLRELIDQWEENRGDKP